MLPQDIDDSDLPDAGFSHDRPSRNTRPRPSTAGRTRAVDIDYSDDAFKNWASAVTPDGHVYYYHKYECFHD